jgi:hypothetical protein
VTLSDPGFGDGPDLVAHLCRHGQSLLGRHPSKRLALTFKGRRRRVEQVHRAQL